MVAFCPFGEALFDLEARAAARELSCGGACLRGRLTQALPANTILPLPNIIAIMDHKLIVQISLETDISRETQAPSCSSRNDWIRPLIHDHRRRAAERRANLKTSTFAGASLCDIVTVTYVLPNGEDFESCWPVLKKYLGNVRPAAMMISAKLLDPRMKIEIQVTAMKQST
jgi:hypothetical protein